MKPEYEYSAFDMACTYLIGLPFAIMLGACIFGAVVMLFNLVFFTFFGFYLIPMHSFFLEG